MAAKPSSNQYVLWKTAENCSPFVTFLSRTSPLKPDSKEEVFKWKFRSLDKNENEASRSNQEQCVASNFNWLTHHTARSWTERNGDLLKCLWRRKRDLVSAGKATWSTAIAMITNALPSTNGRNVPKCRPKVSIQNLVLYDERPKYVWTSQVKGGGYRKRTKGGVKIHLPGTLRTNTTAPTMFAAWWTETTNLSGAKIFVMQRFLYFSFVKVYGSHCTAFTGLQFSNFKVFVVD